MLAAILDRIPLVQNLRGYRFRDFLKDLRAGVNVALLDFPQGMAYAMIAGLPVQFGIYSSAIGSITGPMFASSRFLMLGPTNASAVLLLSGYLSMGLPDDQKLIVLPLLLVMVAAMMFLGALLNVEVVIQYVSRSVITGYITAAAFLIIINQVQNVLGLEVEKSGTFLGACRATLGGIGGIHLPTLAFSVATIVVYFLIRKLIRFLPAVAGTLVVMTVAGVVLGNHGHPFESLPPVTSGAWPLTWPVFDPGMMNQLLGTAFAIAFLSLLESASIAKTLAARAGDTVNIRQQMVSMGVADMVNAFGSGMPVSGSLTRSMLNWSSGARTPVSSIVSGCILALGVLMLGGAIQFIPKAALAALVILVGVSVINWKNVKSFLVVSRSDAATFLMTFASGLILPLDKAIYVGVGISIVLFLKKVGRPQLVEYDFNERGELAEKPESKPRDAISIVHVEGDLFFGSTDIFQDQVRSLVNSPAIKVVILRLLNAHHIDASAALAIRDLTRFARSQERHVLISGIRADVRPVLERARIDETVGADNMFDYTPENVTLSTRNALKRAQEIIGTKSADILFFAKDKQAPADEAPHDS